MKLIRGNLAEQKYFEKVINQAKFWHIVWKEEKRIIIGLENSMFQREDD